MHSIALLAYALAVGLTIAGLGGSAVELFSGRRLGFRPPFVAPKHIGRSLALTMAVGPFMLANDAMAARHDGAIDSLALLLCAFAAMAWSMATGVLVVELAFVMASLLG